MYIKLAFASFFIMLTIILPFLYSNYNEVYQNTFVIKNANMNRILDHVLSNSKSKISNQEWSTKTDFCLNKNYELILFEEEGDACENNYMGGKNKIVIHRGDKGTIDIYDNNGLQENKKVLTIPFNN